MLQKFEHLCLIDEL